MKIVIVGDGKVGFTLTQQLSREGHDVVVIDNNSQVLQQAQEALDVLVVPGNGATLEVQREAGVDEADILIAATSTDEINLLCCILARKLGCKNTIARTGNPAYEGQLAFLKDELGLSLTVNPDKAAAAEILQILQVPSALKRDSFAKSRVEILEVRVGKDSPLCDLPLYKFSNIVKVSALVCAVERGSEVLIPTGQVTLQAGDKISIGVAARDIGQLVRHLGVPRQKVQTVILIGGSRIVEYLGGQLLHEGMRVKIIERNFDRCEQLAEVLPDALIIHGDGTKHDVLLSEGIRQTDALVALTGIDEENLIISMYAKSLGVPKCITKIDRSEYITMFAEHGVDTVVSPKLLTANQIVHYVRACENSVGSAMLTLCRIADGKAEAVEFSVSPEEGQLGIPLKELQLREGTLLACINRDGRVILPRGDDMLLSGDTVVVITSADAPIVRLAEIFQGGKA